MTFKICRRCGNLVGMIRDSGAAMTCCGQEMETLNPNTTDAAGEKHVPAVTVTEDKVIAKVGTVTHPMLPEHFIQWIASGAWPGCSLFLCIPLSVSRAIH